MTRIRSETPKFFKLFASLCLFLGGIGFIANTFFLILGLSHVSSPNIKDIPPATWLSAFHLFRDAGYLAGGIKIRRRVGWARQLLVICAATSLFELFYNTLTLLTKGEIRPSPSTIAYFLLPLLLEGSVLIYYSRKSVRDFVQTPSD